MAADRAALWFQPWPQMQLHKLGKSWLWLWLDSVTFHCFIFPKPKEHQSCPQSHWFVPTLPSSFQMARCIPGILSHCKTCATKDFSVFAKGSMLARRIGKSTLIQPLFSSSFQWPKIRSWSLDKSVPWSIKWWCWAMFFLSRFFQIDCGTTIHRAYGSFPSLEVTVVATSQCLTEQVTKTFETGTLFFMFAERQKKPTLPGYCVELVLAARPRWYWLVKLYARVLPCEKLRSSKEHWCSRGSCSCVRYVCIEFMWRSPLYHNWHQNKGSVEQTIHDESHLFEVLLEWDRIWILNFNISLASNLTQIFWPSLSIWDPSHRATLKPYL